MKLKNWVVFPVIMTALIGGLALEFKYEVLGYTFLGIFFLSCLAILIKVLRGKR